MDADRQPSIEAEKRARERSSIEFPYGDLDDALIVARAIHENAGIECATDQLAGYMRQTTTSGTFRQRVSTARIFGLVETERGGVRLTERGRGIVEPANEAQARADAFLGVPLYRAIYENYRGRMLPPTAALQREMQNLGVSSKQTGKARQAFERSAEQAGLFATGNDRLVMPSGAVGPPQQPTRPPPAERRESERLGGSGAGGGGGREFHPFIEGLLSALPEPETDWSIEDRGRWLQTAANIFGLIYRGRGDIIIKASVPSEGIGSDDT